VSLKVEKLFLHPIKSCGGIEVSEFIIGESGPQVSLGSSVIGDREWMFVDEEGKFLTQRSLTSMALIRPILEKSRFFVELQGQQFEIPLEESSARTTVSVWGKEVDAAVIKSPLNEAVSDFLKKPVQLVHFDSVSSREALIKGRSLGVQTRFTDSQPYLMVTAESLQDLNSRMNSSVDFQRFRPNVVLSGARSPFEEDHWRYLGNESVIFESTKACARCKIITVDPQTGKIPTPEPLVALSKFRKKESAVYFGQYFLSRSFGETLQKGMKLQAQEAQSTG
jgi:hypothetical protein